MTHRDHWTLLYAGAGLAFVAGSVLGIGVGRARADAEWEPVALRWQQDANAWKRLDALGQQDLKACRKQLDCALDDTGHCLGLPPLVVEAEPPPAEVAFAWMSPSAGSYELSVDCAGSVALHGKRVGHVTPYGCDPPDAGQPDSTSRSCIRTNPEDCAPMWANEGAHE